MLRHLLAIAAFPFTVAVLIPVLIARGTGFVPSLPADAINIAAVASGIVFLSIGLALFAATLRLFATVGQGTLAPWDPPKHLVVRGPYRYVRNPMISGVLFVLFGESLILRSWPHLEWTATFLVLNLIYIPLLEEPPLAERFGEPYREYRRHVGRFIPRLDPWPDNE